MQKIVLTFFFLAQLVLANTGQSLQIPESGGTNILLSPLHKSLFCDNYDSYQPIKQNYADFLANDREKDEMPHFTAGALPKQIIVGGVGGALLGLLGGTVGADLVSASHADDGWAALGGFLIGGYSGFVIGNIGGVYIAGRSQKLNGSLWATVAGGAAGVVSGIGIASATNKGWGLFVLPLLGATIAFNLSI